MYDLLAYILSPFISFIYGYYFFIFNIIHSSGLSIIVLSISLSLVLIPILRVAREKEEKIAQKIHIVNGCVAKNTSHLKGEEKFIETEKIYKENKYHPIQNIQKGLSFFVLLPVLISAFLFFNINIEKFDVIFFNVINLSQPDKLLFNINVMPVLIFMANYIDSKYRFNPTKKSNQNNYLFLSLIICFLIYEMPSCLTIYWLSSSLFSMIFSYMYFMSSSKKVSI